MIQLKKMKIKKLIGIYKKTDKNVQCSDFYEKLNFKKISTKKFSINLTNLKINLNKSIKIDHE